MSLKLHQTGGGGGGRRTPLSLGQKSTKISTPEVIDLDAADDLPLSQTIGKLDKKSSIPIATERHQHQVSTSSAVHISELKQSSTPRDTISNDKKDNKSTGKKDNTNDKKKYENGHNNDHNKDKESKSNGQHKKLEENKNNGNSGIIENVIPLVSEQKSNNPVAGIEKAVIVEPEIKEKPASGTKSKKLTEKEKKEKKLAEGNGSGDNVVMVTPPKRTQRAAAIQANASIASLALEKELKGFNENGDEMESFLMDMDTDMELQSVTINTPVKPTEIIPMVQEKELKLEINDSPIKPIELPISITTTPVAPQLLPITSTPDGSKHYYTQPPSSLRSISGRRSLRPMKEYSFQSTSYRDSYRKMNSEFDSTGGNTSMNVTVGSEIAPPANESSFSFFGRGKKRERTSNIQQPTASTAAEVAEDDTEMNTSIKSPKRARMDFSGFLGFVASPVTMLRSRLSRAKIQVTPEKLTAKSTVEEIVEDFSGIVADENVSVAQTGGATAGKEHDDEYVDVEIDDERIKETDNDKSLVDGEEITEENEKNLSDLSDAVIADEDDIKVVETETARRRMCSIM